MSSQPTRLAMVMHVALLVGVAFGGLAVTAVVSSELRGASEERAERRFQEATTRATDLLHDQITAAQWAASAVDGLITADADISESEYLRFVELLHFGGTFPAALALNLIKPVAPEDVPALEREVRVLGVEGFEVHPPAAPGATVQWPMIFIAPREGNEPALGFDVMANPVAGAAALEVIRTDVARMSGPLTLVQEPGSQTGFVIYTPIGPSNGPGGTAGYVVSLAFRGTSMLQDVYSQQHRLAVRVRDAAVEGPDGLIGSYVPDGGEFPTSGRVELRTLDILGRTWSVEVRPVRGFAAISTAADVAMGSGMLLTGLLILLIRSLARGREQAARLAAEATNDLVVSQAELAATNAVLEQVNADLERSNGELRRFAHAASHDLRAPLRTMVGFAKLLQKDLVSRQGPNALTPMEERYVDTIIGGAERMQSLIDDLLQLSRLEAPAESDREVDVTDMVHGILALLQEDIVRSEALVEVGSLAPVIGHGGQLELLVRNLVSNALKFRHPDRPLTVAVGAVEVDGAWELTVADSGIGIPAEERERVLEPFARLHGREAYDGTGLGLAICSSVVTAHGGAIRMEGNAVGGTTVRVTLPGRAVVGHVTMQGDAEPPDRRAGQRRPVAAR